VPEIAARAHAELMTPLVETALADAGLTLDDVDAIAATAGPGLIGGVMVGLVTAKALAMAADKPLIAVNHLEGHALSPRLIDPDLGFPYLLLLVSGGHCQLLRVNGVGDYDRLATTIDDAVGEAFRQEREDPWPRLSRWPCGREGGESRAMRRRCRCPGR
jgi:N6-L-threonylcarbamoyladenine synthase